MIGAPFRPQLLCEGSTYRLLETLRPQQSSSVQVEIGKGEVHFQSVRVLGDTSIAYFREPEDPLDNVEDVLDSGADTRLGMIDLAFAIGKSSGPSCSPLREILSHRRLRQDHLTLATVRRVTPDASLPAVQEIAEDSAIVNVGRRGDERVDDPGLAVDADVRLHPEEPIVTFPGLMHLGIALSRTVLGRAGRMDDRRVNDRSGIDLDFAADQMLVDLAQNRKSQVVTLEQVAELADRRLVRDGGFAKVDPGKGAHRNHIVERFFDRGIAEVEPLLEEVDPQHPLERNRRPAELSAGIVRLDQRAQPFPGDDGVHLGEERRTFGRARKPLEPRARKRHLLFVIHQPKYSKKALTKSEYP